MVAQCENGIQNASFKSPWIRNGLEEALVFVSSIYPLPLLKASDTVTFAASEQSHAMPTNYHWNVTHAHNTTDDLPCTIWPSETNMLDKLGYTASEYTGVENIAVEASTMYVPYPVESEQVIKVWYQKTVTSLATDPDCTAIPAHLHEELLVNRVVEKAYKLLEDGRDGKRANWQFYRTEFGDGLTLLREFYPRVDKHYTYIHRSSYRV